MKVSVYLGKHFVKMGQITSLSNRIMMDVARSHVVLVAGKRGGGKCVAGDTLIPLNDGSVLPIRELAEDFRNLFGLNEELKINQLKKSDFFEREVDKVLYVKLRSGREIKLTSEHPLLTINGWRPVKELNVGSRIATERKIECFGKEDMPEERIKLLAYLLAEGHIVNSYCLFSNMDDKIFKDFEDSVKRFDKNLKVVEWPKGRKGCYGVTQLKKEVDISNLKIGKNGCFVKGSKIKSLKSSMVRWLIDLGVYNKKSVDKFIPQEIFRLPKNQLALFLNRLFSCDGSIFFSTNHWGVSYSSSSEKLIRQVQHLLLRFGVLSKLRKKHVKCNLKLFETFELNVESVNVVKFIEEIGFYGYKEEKECAALDHFKSIITNPNIDTIPREIWETFSTKKLGCCWKSSWL